MLKKVSIRFNQLKSEIEVIDKSIRQVPGRNGGSYTIFDVELAFSWKVKLCNLILTICGNNSSYYSELIKLEKYPTFNIHVYRNYKSIFLAAYEDYQNGYLTTLTNLVHADIFDSELEQAKELLRNKYITAAAVISGVVLETTLRHLCTNNGIEHGKLDKMNADLAKASVYNKLQQKKITAIADIRNSAAHGRPENFKYKDVENMIMEIENFLAIYLI